MSAKAVWREMWVQYRTCRVRGHVWGEQVYWGDAATDHRGTHRCNRCGSCGFPTTDGDA